MPRLDLPPRLVAGPFSLRALQEEDWRLEQALSRCADVVRWTRYRPDLDEAGARHRIARSVRMVAAGDGRRYAVVDAGAAVLGTAGLGRSDGGLPEVFYALLPTGRGRGAATEAVRALVGRAHAAGHPRVRLLTLTGNGPSERVAQRSGFAPVGTEQDTIRGVPVVLRVWEHAALDA